MTINYQDLNKAETFLINWQYKKLEGAEMELAQAIAKSDSGNRKVFSYFFPEYSQAITDFQSKEGYWPSIEVKAGLLDPNWKEKMKERQLKHAAMDAAFIMEAKIYD